MTRLPRSVLGIQWYWDCTFLRRQENAPSRMPFQFVACCLQFTLESRPAPEYLYHMSMRDISRFTLLTTLLTVKMLLHCLNSPSNESSWSDVGLHRCVIWIDSTLIRCLTDLVPNFTPRVALTTPSSLHSTVIKERTVAVLRAPWRSWISAA